MREPMMEERLEIIEKHAHREEDEVLIEVCHEVRRLQARVSSLASMLRKERKPWIRV